MSLLRVVLNLVLVSGAALVLIGLVLFVVIAAKVSYDEWVETR